MNFDDSPDEGAFRAEVRAFLDAHATAKQPGSLASSYYGKAPTAEAEREHVTECKVWQRSKFDNGWAGITWPRAFGGRAGTAVQQGIFSQEESTYDVATGVFSVGIGMAGPTLITHGSEEQKLRYLDPMLRGD